MRIVYDGHIFRWQKAGGISRYFWEIISRLPAEWNPVIVGTNGATKNLPPHSHLSVSGVAAMKPRRLSQPLKTAWWKQSYLQSARVFHPTYYRLSGGLNYLDVKCPVVVTVHDFIHATYPELIEDSELNTRLQREAILRADYIVCISKATERELLERFPQAAGRTSVIYHGSSFAVSETTPVADIFEKPSFLFIGGRGGYKNFTFLLHAFAKAHQSNANIRLQVVGPPLTEEEKWQIHLLGIAGAVRSSVFPGEKELKQFYHNSAALLYPTRHEGFGIPPLEAMACGTVSVSSNTSSLPEVVGDAGIMLDPGDEKAWTECILSIASQRVPRAEMIEKGRKRAKTFRWEDSAARHIEIYRKFQ